MSNGVNKATLVGRLGADVEVRQTATGKSVANLSIATKYGDATTWHRAVCWGKVADFAGNLKSGELVYVEGRMDYRNYTDKSGSERTSAEIVVHDLQALGPKDRGSTEPTGGPAKDYPDGNVKDNLDDLPF